MVRFVGFSQGVRKGSRKRENGVGVGEGKGVVWVYIGLVARV